MRAFFEGPTVAELARVVGKPAAEPDGDSAAAIQRIEELLREVEELPEMEVVKRSGPMSSEGNHE